MPLGEAACLGAALLWAVSVQVFSGPIARHGARSVNLFKCTFATVGLGLTLIATGRWHLVTEAGGFDLFLVAVSGLVGLSLGDSALFAAVNRIGVHRSLLVHTTAPVFAAVLAFTLGERLSRMEAVGALVVLMGIIVVLAERGEAGRVPGSFQAGVAFGLLGAFGQGAGVVIAKIGMEGVAVFPATFVRLGAGALGLITVAAVSGGSARIVRAFQDPRTLPPLVIASFFGTYVAMYLMMTGIAWAPASVAAVLLATSPVFGLGVEAVVRRRWPSVQGVVGTVVAVAGVALLSRG